MKYRFWYLEHVDFLKQNTFDLHVGGKKNQLELKNSEFE